MNIINSKFQILTEINEESILQFLENIGRKAYKSEDKICKDSGINFILELLKKGHESVIEHFSISVLVICDRGISHEIVRHRIASYTQESTRYCNYSKGQFGGELTFIEPCFWLENTEANQSKQLVWRWAMLDAEKWYMRLLQLGATPQEARSVLPNSLKTEIVMTMNLREWRHFFKLRTAKTAHPQMQEIANMILKEFKIQLPTIFGDINQ